MDENKQKENKKVEKKVKKSKIKKQVPKANVYVKSSYNNTAITFTDLNGNVLSTSSSGTVGFSGSKKSTAYAATRAGEDAYQKAQKYGVKEAVVYIKGAGMGRQAAVKGLRTSGLKITLLSDITPVPHNGCRPKRKPRGS